MAKYTFKCHNCRHVFILTATMQSFSGDAVCPRCGTRTNNRIYSKPGLVIKMGVKKKINSPPGKVEHLVDRE